jgi:hypothetical protein
MAESIMHSCDICGEQRGEANHWFRWKNSDGMLIIAPWENFQISQYKTGHLCGPGCVQRKVNEFTEEAKNA